MPDQGLQEADWVVGLMMAGFLAIGPKAVELYMEVRYIKAFAQENLLDKDDSCQCLVHIETALEMLLTGTINEYLSGAHDSQQGVSRSSNASYSRKRSEESSISDKGQKKSNDSSSRKNQLSDIRKTLAARKASAESTEEAKASPRFDRSEPPIQI